MEIATFSLVITVLGFVIAGCFSLIMMILNTRKDAQEGREKLTERMDQRFDAVDKRFGKVDQRFDAVDKRFEKVDQRFDAVDKRFEKVDQRFDAVDKQFEKMDRRFDANAAKLEATNESLTHRIDKLHTQLIRIFLDRDEALTSLLRERQADLEFRQEGRPPTRLMLPT